MGGKVRLYSLLPPSPIVLENHPQAVNILMGRESRWVIFEASYIFCCALAKKCQLTQHTSGYVKPIRRLKIKVRVERF